MAGPRRLAVLGSTGSIGCNTLAVAEHLARQGMDLRVVALAAQRNAGLLIEQAQRLGVRHVAVCDADAAARVRGALPDATVYAGDDAAERLVREVDCTDVAAAIVGIAGLPATLAAAELGRRIHLSNKETLVAAGDLIRPLIGRSGAALLPVDSEHSAVFQCLHGRDARHVRRLVLTASGGPFRETDLAEMRAATPEQALAHPTWDMGPKVTIDSATMMNKALEVIEAHHLFGLPAEQIEAIIHPQSVVHSFVELHDGSVLAQLGPPDMRGPIQAALTWPGRAAGISEPMDWQALRRLDFEPLDPQRFPAVQLAFRAIRAGGTAGAVLNAANEAAVQAFLDLRIPFGRIVELAALAMDTIPVRPADTLDAVLDADRRARALIEDTLSQTPAARD
jgi:1-deoxy-D-xylulose-5-phosphate reductoisomerase